MALILLYATLKCTPFMGGLGNLVDHICNGKEFFSFAAANKTVFHFISLNQFA
jgi:lipoprotein signal peptidase